MQEQFCRTEILIGSDAMEKLRNSRVAIFGIGGVGGYVCEALVRSGIGEFDIIDNDTVSVSNLNRQIIATTDTVGKDKVEVMRERMLSINPNVKVNVHKCFFLPETAGEFDFTQFNFVVDAIDTVTGKIQIILKAKEAGVPVISSMGTGNKLDPGRLRIADIKETKVCPLAKVMRHELKKRGVDKLKVVFSDEIPITPMIDLSKDQGENPGSRRAIPGSTAFTPAVAGLLIASEVVRDLIK